jgi:hypothetical protein
MVRLGCPMLKKNKNTSSNLSYLFCSDPMGGFIPGLRLRALVALTKKSLKNDSISSLLSAEIRLHMISSNKLWSFLVYLSYLQYKIKYPYYEL